MTWHDEKEPPVYAAGERQAELEALTNADLIEALTRPGSSIDGPSPRVQAAFALFKELTEDERCQVLCWFCRGCYRYVGPGDNCTCESEAEEKRTSGR